VLAHALDGRTIALRASSIERLIEVSRDNWLIRGDTHACVIDEAIVRACATGPLADRPLVAAALVRQGDERLAIAVDGFDDLAPLAATPTAGGLVRLDGRTVELLDPAMLFGDLRPALAPDVGERRAA
jgi:hypothetical protein